MTQLQDLRREITIMREAAEIRNRELDALHLVWCSGGCERGIHRWAEERPDSKQLAELIEIGERNLDRLRSRQRGAEFRENYGHKTEKL